MTQTPTATQERKFKQLLITNHDGSTQYIPDNKSNLLYHKSRIAKIRPDKAAKCKIEHVELSLDEAAEIGISEAIQIKYPPKKQAEAGTSELMMAMLQQQIELNRQLSERLAKLETASEPKAKGGK